MTQLEQWLKNQTKKISKSRPKDSDMKHGMNEMWNKTAPQREWTNRNVKVEWTRG